MFFNFLFVVFCVGIRFFLVGFFAIYIFDTDITVNKRVEYVIVEIPVSQKLFTLIKSVTFESYHNKDFQLTENYSHLTLVSVVWLTQALNFKPRHKVMWHLIIFLLSLVDNAAWIGQFSSSQDHLVNSVLSGAV